MIDLLISVGIGIVLGYLLKREQRPPIVEILQNQVENYEKQIVYYKDLCEWHVLEKEKLKREHYIK